MKFRRELLDQIDAKLLPGKVCIIYGTRRVGKSELIKAYLTDKSDYLLLNGDDILDVQLLNQRSTSNYRRLLVDKKLLVIDEAQNIPEIGLKLKLMVDEIDGLSVLITGSSALDLSQKSSEPLVGRMTRMHLFTISYRETTEHMDFKLLQESLPQRLVMGSYPEVFQYTTQKDQIDYLMELVNTYLLKDVLAYGDIRKSNKLMSLLQLLAYQMGSEVSYSELAKSLQLSKNTIEKYIELLIQTFILYKVSGYSKNLRKEVTKQPKIYFTDNGIRNAIIGDFTSIDQRRDRGILWENYCIQERIKRLHYDQIHHQAYYWRTYDQQEIDWIESYNQELHAYEMKWKKTSKVPQAFAKSYPDASYTTLNSSNYYEYL